jgi:hypothetical protein
LPYLKDIKFRTTDVTGYRVFEVVVSQAAPKNIKVSAVVSETGKMAGAALQCKISYERFVEKINAEARFLEGTAIRGTSR